MPTTIIIAIAAVVFLGGGTYAFLRLKTSRELKTLALLADKALEKLNSLTIPSHIFTSDEAESFKEDHKALYTKALSFSKNFWLSQEAFKNSSLPKFILAFESIDKELEKNAEIRQRLKIVNEGISQVAFLLKQYLDDDHYFAFSEAEKLMNDFSDFFNALNSLNDEQRSLLDKKEEAEKILKETSNIEKTRQYHNSRFVEKEKDQNKDFFDNVLQYPLDPQQRDAIVKLEDNTLVISSAGSGKTSTIVGKTKYLVDVRQENPQDILLVTYTKKAAEELSERMSIMGLTCSTFHSLAYRIIADVTDRKPTICSNGLMLNAFHDLMDHDTQFVAAIDEYIINLQSLMKWQHEYTDAVDYYTDRKKYGIQSLFPDMDGRISFTKSEEEKRLCSYLTKLGVSYRYEEPYAFMTATKEYQQYKPDFTIYWQSPNRRERIYLEHFGIDKMGNVPQWFGQNERGGWLRANERYHEGIQWKRDLHKQHRTVLLETTSADFHDGTIYNKLKSMLIKAGVPVKEKSAEELYRLMVSRSKKLERSVFNLIQSFVMLAKSNSVDLQELQNQADMELHGREIFIIRNIIIPYANHYEDMLRQRGEIDFTDAILKATEFCKKGAWRKYKYILVDEFQDISRDRYKFLLALRNDYPRTKLFCVGDDWQSIYRFSGSDMSLFYEFEKYFGFTEKCKIETTYRFHSPVIQKSSEFIMQNPEQLKKNIHSPKAKVYSELFEKHVVEVKSSPNGNKIYIDGKLSENDDFVIQEVERAQKYYPQTYIDFLPCSEENGTLEEVKKILQIIPSNESVIIIGRYNYDARSLGFNYMPSQENLERINIKIDDRTIQFMSVHGAKGLEADNVILINCNQGMYGFPSLIEDDPLLDFVLSKADQFEYAEERRLFYVAITRAKKHMYVLYDIEHPSPFVEEFKPTMQPGHYKCPVCMEGEVVKKAEGMSKNGRSYTFYACNNLAAHCDYHIMLFGNHEHPGILVK